jgi:hypothetical protein
VSAGNWRSTGPAKEQAIPYWRIQAGRWEISQFLAKMLRHGQYRATSFVLQLPHTSEEEKEEKMRRGREGNDT